jgi:hypothetical protein
MSAATAIVWPAFALFALTLGSVTRLARMRFAAARAGRVDPRFYKVFQGQGEPPELAATSRNVVNLYEMPTLFYAGTAIAFAAHLSGGLLVALAWAYVALRFAHSVIHVTSNRVMWRFRAFLASWIVLAAYLAWIGASLFFATDPPPATG